MIWLAVGPTFAAMLRFTGSVLSLTTDSGVERLIPAMRDVLPEFMVAIGCVLPRGWRRRKRTFPLAVRSPGWKHVWDGLMRRGCHLLYWWPSFLKQLKGIVYVLRDHDLLKTLMRSLRRTGRQGLADLLKKLHLPNFAQWRWGTLTEVCAKLTEVWSSLSVAFDIGLFGHIKEEDARGHLRSMGEDCRDPSWPSQFGFITWFSGWLGNIQKLVHRCVCHAHLYDTGEAPRQCVRQGRLLPIIFELVTDKLRQGFDQITSWTPDTFTSTIAFVTNVQGCVRQVYMLAMEHVRVFDRVPYLLARLNQRGVKDKAL